jgi:methanethiol S-methyltransferase
VLLVVYARLARSEERDSLAEFGTAYEEYRKHVPAFIPTFGKHELQSGYP